MRENTETLWNIESTTQNHHSKGNDIKTRLRLYIDVLVLAVLVALFKQQTKEKYWHPALVYNIDKEFVWCYWSQT